MNNVSQHSMDFILIILGLVGLVIGAELTIKGALRIAQYYGFSHTFVGLTVLALGTDLPELSIVLAGSIENSLGGAVSDILVGEVIGSAMSQIMIVLGILGLFRPTTVKAYAVLRDGTVALLAVLMVFFFGLDGQLVGSEGGVMILLYVVYLVWLYTQERGQYTKSVVEEKDSMFWSILFLLAGFSILAGAAQVTLGSAVALSSYFGIPQYIVGFYVIGLGTSLPELVTSFVALKRRASGMAVGNILGSNILDLLLVLGVGSVVSDLWVSSGVVRLDLPFLCGVTFFVLLFLFRAKKLSKKISITLVLGYILFSFLRFILIV